MKHSLRYDCLFPLLFFVHFGLNLPVAAQTALVLSHAPATAVDGEEFNAFFMVQTSPFDTLNALALELPRGMQLLRVSAAESPVRFSIKNFPNSRSRINAVCLASEPLSAPLLLVLTLRASESFAERTERLQAYLIHLRLREFRPALLDSLCAVARAQVSLNLTIQPKRRHENFAALLDSLNQSQVFLPNTRAAQVSLQRNFTVEFWLRTTALSRIVLSTWSGVATDAYALEVELLADGRIGAFLGTPFSFSRLVSLSIVGDGSWHHCAITHDSARAIMRLFVDGRLHDSVQTQVHRAAFTPSVERRTVLYLGSRAGREKFFHGELDEFKLYRRAKSAQELASPEVLEKETDPSLLVSESFSPMARSLLSGARLELVRASLASVARLRNLRADLQNGTVQLSWEFTGQSNASSFTIERSTDGVNFQSISTIEISSTQSYYRFTDRLSDAALKVGFYRIRINTPGRASVLSQTLKVGLGETKQFVLHQNVPNPFNPTTTITYELFAPSSVELIIYNMLGNEITRIRYDNQPAGMHKYIFNASEFDLSSGTYLYRLQTATGAEIRKMILMK